MLLAWGVFQPPWWNFDYAIDPAFAGSSLEEAIFAWGKSQIMQYSKRTKEWFWGSIELFEDAPNQAQTIAQLEALGFQPFEWTTMRFAIDLNQPLPQPQMPDGYVIRPIRAASEAEAYVALQRAAFNSEKMTTAWRMRSFEHPDYRPKLDLILADANDTPIGFCVCWLKDGVGQIEPLGVHPDHQGKGLGRALELAALQMMRAHGAHTALVDHVSLNDAAIALSKQTGFRQINNALRFYIDTGDPN